LNPYSIIIHRRTFMSRLIHDTSIYDWQCTCSIETRFILSIDLWTLVKDDDIQFLWWTLTHRYSWHKHCHCVVRIVVIQLVACIHIMHEWKHDIVQLIVIDSSPLYARSFCSTDYPWCSGFRLFSWFLSYFSSLLYYYRCCCCYCWWQSSD
jgi:hypothetical protein